MLTINPLEIEGMIFTAIRIELPNTNVFVISNEVGYIMCAALNVDGLHQKGTDRPVIAGNVTGVSTIEELLAAPLEKITDASREYGWEPGITGRDALCKIA